MEVKTIKRVEDLEFRWSDFNKAYEIVRWNETPEYQPYCYVIAFVDRKRDSVDIRFVGDRPFRYENRDLLWKVMQFAQSYLEAEVALELDI